MKPRLPVATLRPSCLTAPLPLAEFHRKLKDLIGLEEKQEQTGENRVAACSAATHHPNDCASFFFVLASVWRISAVLLQHYSTESALVFVSVYTHARSVDKRTVRPQHCTCTQQEKGFL